MLTAPGFPRDAGRLAYIGGMGGVSAITHKEASLVGREEELSRLRELVAPPYPESRVMLLLGDPGAGKTALLAEAAREAQSAGMRVLAAAGRESERDLAFAGLHQLLRPVLGRLVGLPARQAEALRGAFGLSEHVRSWRSGPGSRWPRPPARSRPGHSPGRAAGPCVAGPWVRAASSRVAAAVRAAAAAAGSWSIRADCPLPS